MDTGGARSLNRSSPSCVTGPAQRTDFFHGLMSPPATFMAGRILYFRLGSGDEITLEDLRFALQKISWLTGPRDGQSAYDFMMDLADRLAGPVQLTTDGLRLYVEAVEAAFGMDVDYAQLVKIYGDIPEGERRYSTPQCKAAVPR